MKTMTMRNAVAGVAVVLGCMLAGCKGAEGPMGPAGAQGPGGPQGPAGVVARATFLVTLGSTGGGAATLPPEAGSDANKPPALSCYMSDPTNPTRVWSAVSDSYSDTSPYCGLVLSSGRWSAVMVDGVPGWTAAFVVGY